MLYADNLQIYILGPILFSLYINDLKYILSNFKGPDGILSDSVTHLLYTDDLLIYKCVTLSDKIPSGPLKLEGLYINIKTEQDGPENRALWGAEVGCEPIRFAI